jgi:hypothetical protein
VAGARRTTLRQLSGLVIVACVAALTVAARPALAQGPAPEPTPTELWEEYSLEPLQGQAGVRRPAMTVPSGTDWTLLGGGLALVLLSLGATLLLTFSVRLLRDSERGALL